MWYDWYRILCWKYPLINNFISCLEIYIDKGRGLYFINGGGSGDGGSGSIKPKS